jgi:ABC-type amino acid transport system permease subunit
MFLLVSDLGTVVWGVSAANALGTSKAIFFAVGLCYGANTFYNAARVYVESFHMVPKGICRKLVMSLAWMFFVSWALFPLAFIAGTYLKAVGTAIKHMHMLMRLSPWSSIESYLLSSIAGGHCAR